MDWHQPEQWTDIRRIARAPCAGIVDRLAAEFAMREVDDEQKVIPTD